MKDQIIKFYKGLPGSGKSTLAKAWVSKNPTERVRVNKDDLRLFLHQGKYSKGNETQVLEIQDLIIVNTLKKGKSIAIDNTNLIDKHFKNLKELLKNHNLQHVNIQVEDLTSVSPTECIKRDLKRVNSVGPDVIWKMYWDHVAIIKVPELSVHKRDAILVDVDGTLAQMKDRHPYEWDKVGTDIVRSYIRNLSNVYRRVGYDVLVLTGRDDICREATIDWLIKNDIGFDELYLRAANDTREDFIIKREIYEEHIAPNYNIHLVVDDRPQVIREWRRLGLPVINANPCDREF